jgi:hypothetical protein
MIGGEISQEYLASMLKLHTDAQALSNMVMWYRLLLADYTMIIMLRFFKAFKGQARLAVVTNTIVHASADLFHFGIVFVSAFLTFTFSGMILFGRRMNGFSTFEKAFGTCFAIACGDFDWGALSYENYLTATMWFWSFMVLIFLVMLNMVLAIVMDVYTSVRAEAINGEPIWVSLFDMGKKAKDYQNYLYQKAIDSPDIPPRDVKDSVLYETVRSLGSKVTMQKLQVAHPEMSDAQAERILSEVEAWEKDQTEPGMNMSDALRMIKTINGKVDSLVKKIDYQHSLDPTLNNQETPQQKAQKARRKFKRAIFTALHNG